MRLALKDIDPEIGQKLYERLTTPTGDFLRDDILWRGSLMPVRWEFQANGVKARPKRRPSVDEQSALDLRRHRDSQYAARLVSTVLLSVLMFISIGFVARFWSAWIMGSLLSAWAAATAAGIYWTRHARIKTRLAQQIRLEEMRAAFPLLSLTRAERVYCDTLQLLARTESDSGTERTLRDTLRQLNDLLTASRDLEQKRLSLVPLLGSNVLSELETEYGALGMRLDQTRDPIARQSVEQSLQMCHIRLQNARALQAGMERLNAQQEAIVHTMSSAQSSMARMQITPDMQTGHVAEEISQTVTQMNQQTYAVEQAVQEVISLSAHG